MNVFVETNFVLELALEQQESTACEKLLVLSRERAIRLFLPAYSLIEPHETLTRRHLDREALRTRVAAELVQIARSSYFAERAAASTDIAQLLRDSVTLEGRGPRPAKLLRQSQPSRF